MTFRDDIRDGFDRQQARLGEVGDARHRLIQGGLAASEPASHRLQWAAGIAAVLIAAIVIGTFAWVRSSLRPTVPAVTPRANASPTPLRNAVNVLDSTPLILYYDPGTPQQLDGMTWDGKLRGRIASGIVGDFPNPAANLFGYEKEIRDRAGQVVTTGTFGSKYFWGTWADDEDHFCVLVPFVVPPPDGVATTLRLVDARTGAARDVTEVGHYYPGGWARVESCSVKSDRAVVVQSNQGAGATLMWVVELSTGKILWTQDYRGHASMVTVVASPDARYIALDYAGQGPNGATVYRTDGAALTPLPDQPGQLDVRVEGFSWDGSLAVVTQTDGSLAVMRWRDRITVWTCPIAGEAYARMAAQPDGAELAVYASNLTYGVGGAAPAPVDLYVLTADGIVVAQESRIYLHG